jgi:hypothetical protein
MRNANLRTAVKRLILLSGGTLLIAACDRNPTEPAGPRAPSAARRDSSLTCRSGYVIVDGRQVCADT